jgi:hypothetical protein
MVDIKQLLIFYSKFLSGYSYVTRRKVTRDGDKKLERAADRKAENIVPLMIRLGRSYVLDRVLIRRVIREERPIRYHRSLQGCTNNTWIIRPIQSKWRVDHWH